MKRRAKRKDLTQFPSPQVDGEQVKKDVLERQWMSKFTEFHVKAVFYFALLGMTDEQIAHAFEISVTTLNNWKNKFETFRDAIKRGKEEADGNVVHSFYQICNGYTFDSEQIVPNRVKHYNDKGKVIREETKVIRVPIKKHVPPNARAIIKWLEARQPDQWSQREKVTNKITMNTQINSLDMSNISVEDLKVLQRLGAHTQAEGSLEHFTPTTDATRAERTITTADGEIIEDVVEQPKRRRRKKKDE